MSAEASSPANVLSSQLEQMKTEIEAALIPHLKRGRRI